MTSNKPSSSQLATLLVTLFLTIHLNARPSADSLEFSCVSWDRIEGPPVYYLPSPPREKESMDSLLDRLLPVKIPEMTRPPIEEFKGGRQVNFYRKANGIEKFASVNVPAEWKRALFIFFPEDKQGNYRIIPLRDDRKHAPYGSYQFVNLTDLPLSGFIEKTSISLKPREKKIIKPGGDSLRPMDFGIWTTVDNERVWLQRNTLTYKPDKYLIYFFYSREDRMGRLKVESRGIVEFRPPSPKAGTPHE